MAVMRVDGVEMLKVLILSLVVRLGLGVSTTVDVVLVNAPVEDGTTNVAVSVGWIFGSAPFLPTHMVNDLNAVAAEI